MRFRGKSVHTDSSSMVLADCAATEKFDRTATVVVGVATFRRPSQLRDLLPDLIKQAADLDARVVVVDNDPAASARDVVTAAERVHYVHEPRPGLASVRNRLLAEAGDADVLVFIDDDERPTAGWLAALVGVWRRTGCTAVSGPVRSVFQHPPGRLVSETGVFDRVRRPTGTQLTGAATNNLLLDLRWLRSHSLAFDPEFGESGGEDTMLTHSIIAAGGTIVWCDEAEVTETVPADRLRLGWVMRRLVRTTPGRESRSRSARLATLTGRPLSRQLRGCRTSAVVASPTRCSACSPGIAGGRRPGFVMSAVPLVLAWPRPAGCGRNTDGSTLSELRPGLQEAGSKSV